MNRYFLLFILMSFFPMLYAQNEELRIRQEGRNIVVEYDLEADADHVYLYFSQNGGQSFKGPLNAVTGDVKDVKAGGNKRIVWAVVQDVDELKGDVQFKIVKKLKRYYPKETFLSLNGAFALAPQGSFGLTFVQVKKFGWYVSAMTGTGFKMKGDFDCIFDGSVVGIYPFYSGKKSTTRISLTVGGVARMVIPLYVYAGAGIGYRALFWETIDQQWARNKSYSLMGFNAEFGLMGNIKRFVISGGVSTINFNYWEAKIGLGWSF